MLHHININVPVLFALQLPKEKQQQKKNQENEKHHT